MSKNHMQSGGFPDKCDLCQTSILYTQIPNMHVEFKDGYVKNCYCPSFSINCGPLQPQSSTGYISSIMNICNKY